jgi:hypothetical protein
MLAILEQSNPASHKGTSDLLLNHDAIDMHDLAFLDEANGPTGARQQQLFHRKKPRSWRSIPGKIWKRLSPVGLIFWPSLEEGNRVVTRSFAATVRQLRYYSGSSLFFTRGLLLYLFWYRVLPKIFEFVVNLAVYLAYQFLTWLAGRESDRGLFTVNAVTLLVVRGVYFALASEQIAFHTV